MEPRQKWLVVPSARSLHVTFGIAAGGIALAVLLKAGETTDAPGLLAPAGFVLGSFGVLLAVGAVLEASWRQGRRRGRPADPDRQFGAGLLGAFAAAALVASVAAVASYTHLMAQPPGADTSFSFVLLIMAAIIAIAGLVFLGFAWRVLH